MLAVRKEFQFLFLVKYLRLGEPTLRGPMPLEKNMLGQYVGNAHVTATAKA